MDPTVDNQGDLGVTKEFKKSIKIHALLLIPILGKRVSWVGYKKILFCIRIFKKVPVVWEVREFILVVPFSDKSCEVRNLRKVSFKVRRVHIRKLRCRISIEPS